MLIKIVDTAVITIYAKSVVTVQSVFQFLLPYLILSCSASCRVMEAWKWHLCYCKKEVT